MNVSRSRHNLWLFSTVALFLACFLLLNKAFAQDNEANEANEAEEYDNFDAYDYYDDFYLDYDDAIDQINLFKLKKIPLDDDYDEYGFYYEDYDFDYQEVIIDGIITADYNMCDVNEKVTENSPCDRDGPFTDKVDYEFNFAVGVEYDFVAPKVTSSDPTSLTVQVQNFDYDLDVSSGQFTIDYKCLKDSPGIYVTMEFAIFDDTVKTLSWIKECKIGGNLEVLTEYFDENDMVFYEFKEKPLVSTAENSATSIYVSLLPPADRISFDKPVITSSDKDVEVSIRGSIFGGELSADYTEFAVQYTCKAAKVADITLKIPVHPFDPVVMTWKKDCSDNNPEKNEWLSQAADSSNMQYVEIGTDENSDVFHGGIVQAQFQANVDDLNSVISPNSYRIPVEESKTSFFFYYGGASSNPSLVIDRVSVTVGDPKKLSTRIDESKPEYLGTEGGVLVPGTTKSLNLRFICKQKGQSNVLVTIHTVRMDLIEFVFVKDCRLPVRIKESGFLITASSFLWIFAILFFGGLGFAFYRFRKGKTNEIQYSAVPSAPGNRTGPHKV